MARKHLISKSCKIAIALVFSCVLMLGITGCATDSESVIRDSIEQEFNSYKNADDLAMSRVATTAEKEGLTSLGISSEDFAAAVLDGFDYEIKNININGSNATADVIIVSKSMSDFESKLSEAVQSFVASDSAQTMTSDEKSQEIGNIAMNAFEQTKVIEEEVQLDFTLDGNTWTSNNVSETLANTDSLVFAS